jgi:hypothetical protein
MDEALADFATSSHELREVVHKLHGCGCVFPNHNQVESLGTRCVLNDRGILLRKAIAAARDAQFVSRTSKAATLMPLMPTQVGGASARAVDRSTAAIDQLNAMAEMMRAASPEMTLAQAFERAYADPANRDLVERERKENRPVASW